MKVVANQAQIDSYKKKFGRNGGKTPVLKSCHKKTEDLRQMELK